MSSCDRKRGLEEQKRYFGKFEKRFKTNKKLFQFTKVNVNLFSLSYSKSMFINQTFKFKPFGYVGLNVYLPIGRKYFK